jgi:hypothetical protein
VRRFALVFSMIAILASAAHAAEPRPWLCRDKPVFSSGQPMSYQLTAKSSAWELFLMQFTPGAGHDGFDITKTISGTTSGQLASGQYFAVALHRSGGSWICPADVDEDHGGGVISNLCFSGADGGCTVKLVVTPAR